jgi:hypothetical protein
MTTMTTSSRGTFASWLAGQVTRPDTDPVGWLARLWKTREGPDRPKVSSPTGIVKYLKTLSDDGEWLGFLDQAVQAAPEDYRAQVQAQSLADHAPRVMDAPGQVTELRTSDLADQLQDQGEVTLSPPAGAYVQPEDTGPAGVGGQGHVMDIVDLPTLPEPSLSWLADQLMQLQAQVGLVMQMLAVSNPAAAEILLNQLAADAEAAEDSTSSAPIVMTEGQQRAASIAQANGWVPADQPPMPSAAPAGGFETWWGVADPAAGDGDG